MADQLDLGSCSLAPQYGLFHMASKRSHRRRDQKPAAGVNKPVKRDKKASDSTTKPKKVDDPAPEDDAVALGLKSPLVPPESLGPVVPVAGMIGFLVGVWAFAPSVPVLMLVIIAPMFYYISYLTVSLVRPTLIPGQYTGPKPINDDRAILRKVLLLCFSIMLIALTTSLFANWPLPLSNLINPALIRKTTWDTKVPLKLSPHSRDILEDSTAFLPNGRTPTERERRQFVWLRWMLAGATASPGHIVQVYKSEPVPDFYEPLDGKLSFVAAADTKAKLADCFGFVVNRNRVADMIRFLNNDERAGAADYYRRIDLAPAFDNMDQPPGNGLRNDIKGLTLTAGDSVVIVAQFVDLSPVELRNGLPAQITFN